MRLLAAGRWPSIADRDDLDNAITGILDAGEAFESRFYQDNLSEGGFACQGDVVRLRSAAPCIDSDGAAIVTDSEFEHWMILGNTCDLYRDDERWTLIAPLLVLPEPLTDTKLRVLRRYEYSRQFYVPSWPGDDAGGHRMVDFMQFVTLDKEVFRLGNATVVARLQFPAWALLHACIVRFLARDDGRFD
jgi:hypothetical protein